jgi:O-antigen ligase
LNSVLPTNVRLLRLLPLAVAALLGAYGLVATSGVLGVVLLVAILSFAVGLALWVRGADAAARATIARGATGALLFFPAALVVFFSFSSGGFFPDSVALADIVVAVLLIVRLALADRPLAPFSGVALAPLVGVAGLALWALLSQFWSHAPGRATIAFDRDLLYALTFALFASIGASRDRLTWAIRALALAMTVVVGFGLMSRVAADVLPTALDPAADGRLAYPLTYWNAMGVFCAVTAVLCLHLAATDYRRRVRALAAAALPVIGATLLLTYSRGGLAAAAVGLVAYAVLGRPRGLLSALIATAPATAVAMKAAYDATLVSSADPATPAAVHQGHHVALIVLACVVAAGGLRVLLHGLDRRLDGEDSPIDRYAAALRASAAGALLVAVVVAIALGAPNAIAHRWNQFVDQQTVAVAPVVRTRLSSTSNNGRLALWKIEFHAFDAHPLDGTGADTFEILYYEHRPNTATVVNAHSLYIETLGDLGIVGLVLVLLFVLGTLAGAAPFRRGRDRALYAALFGAGLAWALHAGVDWDWQMPAVSIWFAALGGLALGRPVWRAGSGVSTAHVRAFALGAVVVAAAVLPALVLASQLRLTSATSAYAAGDCASADRFARNSLDALGTRAGPWQIEALCDIRGGQYHHALLALDSGLSVDPNDWQLQSAAAATEAVLGFDARAQAASALRLNPLDSGVMALAHALERGPSKQTRQAALAFLSDQSLIVTG